MSCNTSFSFSFSCSGRVRECAACGQGYCAHHYVAVKSNRLRGGHCCDHPCSTSAQFVQNCEGGSSVCPACGDRYCAYHRAPATFVGGHFCTGTYPAVEEDTHDEHLFILAAAAFMAYYDPEEPLLPDLEEDGYCLKYAEEGSGEGILNITTFRPEVRIYENADKVILAVRGTADKADVLADVQSVVGRAPPEFAIAHLEALWATHSVPGKSFLVTGHSLGGFLSEIFACRHALPGASFCGPGVNGERRYVDRPRLHRYFHVINASNDPIGNVFAGLYVHVPWSHRVEVPNARLPHQKHSMQNMLDAMRDKGHLTLKNLESRRSFGTFTWII